MLKGSGLSVLTASTLPPKAKALPWLHAAHRVPEQRHNLGFAAVVAQVLVVDPHPEGLQKVGLGPCKSVAIT